MAGLHRVWRFSVGSCRRIGGGDAGARPMCQALAALASMQRRFEGMRGCFARQYRLQKTRKRCEPIP
jgi:hypothetical protein